MSKTPVRLIDLFRYYRGLPHQSAALTELEDLILKADGTIFNRDQDWFKTWSTDGKQVAANWLPPALTIIKEFEGCRLKAYKCPAGVWTIGYGTTQMMGQKVKEGDAIGQDQAEEYLKNDVEVAARQMFQAIPVARNWNANRIAALTSFTYNVGGSALAQSTLARRLNDRESADAVVREELPRWVKAGDQTLDGLVRRRQAEIKLFTTNSPENGRQPAKVTSQSSFDTRLTPHFTLGEFALNQEERRFLHQWQVDTAAELAAFLERVRIKFGKPVFITSGYRPPALNQAVGGATNSEHLYLAPREGAVDIAVDGIDINTVQDWIDANWPHSVGYGAKLGFVHVGRRAGGQRLRWDY